VAGKQGHCAEKASAGKEIHAEITPCFRRMWRAIGRPARRPYNGITLLLGEKGLARPTQKMNPASWFFRAMPLLPPGQRLKFNPFSACLLKSN
jgi:hypothetical protein